MCLIPEYMKTLMLCHWFVFLSIKPDSAFMFQSVKFWVPALYKEQISVQGGNWAVWQSQLYHSAH